MAIPDGAAHLWDMSDNVDRAPAGTRSGRQFRSRSHREAEVGLDDAAGEAHADHDRVEPDPSPDRGLGRAMDPSQVAEAIAATAYAPSDPARMREKGQRQAEQDATVHGDDYVRQMAASYADAPIDNANFDHYRAGYERHLATTTETVPAGDLAAGDQVLLPDEHRTAVRITDIETVDTQMRVTYEHPEHGTQHDQVDANAELQVLRYESRDEDGA